MTKEEKLIEDLLRARLDVDGTTAHLLVAAADTIERLAGECDAAKAFHDVAVKERDYERARTARYAVLRHPAFRTLQLTSGGPDSLKPWSVLLKPTGTDHGAEIVRADTVEEVLEAALAVLAGREDPTP